MTEPRLRDEYRDDWRAMTLADWDGIRDYATELLAERQAAARHDYGSGLRGEYLRGDPMVHLEIELGDTIAYLHYLRRQRECLESELDRRDALLREGRLLAMAARACEYPGERQALAERLRDWEQRVAAVTEVLSDAF